jgi:putative PIG3 family NAD(P)H quinone oxidoreductase
VTVGATMQAVLPATDGVVRIGELEVPRPGAGEVVLAVRATALNRVDLLQLRGVYPPPPGESPIPGLEAAGTILELGAGVVGWAPGQPAMALLAGGGHAERVVVPAGQLLPIPPGMSWVEAAALPEAAITAWLNLVREGELGAGERVLITAAASGVGAMAVQVARELGAAEVVVAGRDRARLARLRPLGATAEVPLGEGFAERVRAVTAGRGADLAFEMVGGSQLPASLSALAECGRLVLVGLLAGARTELDLALVLRRRLTLRGSVLRPRSRGEKGQIVAAFSAFALPRLEDGRLRPVIDRVLPFAAAAEGYAALAASQALGKIVLALPGAEGG